MNKKLTLSLDEQAILVAKHYAETHNSTVSSLVERYFRALQLEQKRTQALGSLTNQLAGVIQIPDGYDEKGDYRSARAEHLR